MEDDKRDAQEIFEQLTSKQRLEWDRKFWEEGLGILGYSSDVIDELDAMIQEERR